MSNLKQIENLNITGMIDSLLSIQSDLEMVKSLLIASKTSEEQERIFAVDKVVYYSTRVDFFENTPGLIEDRFFDELKEKLEEAIKERSEIYQKYGMEP